MHRLKFSLEKVCNLVSFCANEMKISIETGSKFNKISVLRWGYCNRRLQDMAHGCRKEPDRVILDHGKSILQHILGKI